jgi:hypothetical protein
LHGHPPALQPLGFERGHDEPHGQNNRDSLSEEQPEAAQHIGFLSRK